MRILQTSFLLAVACLMLARTGAAQSLAELSRQQRAKKAGTTTKEFTNDNSPAPSIGSGTAAATPATGTAPVAAGASAGAAAPAGDAAKPGGPAAEKSMADLEKEYREKSAKIKETVATEERRLDVLQRELNLTQQQYYSDPNVALREQYTRADINKRTEEIEAQKQNVEKAKAAFTELENELKKMNLPIGWAR